MQVDQASPQKFTPDRTICIVIPALNESDGISATVASVPRIELQRMGYRVQVLVVDNNSTDNTGELAKQAGAQVVLEPMRGYGRAFKAGFACAQADIIATADADRTYPLEDIPRLVKMLEEERLEFITTNRFPLMHNGAMSRLNKLGNHVLALAVKGLYGINMNDPESGMWVFRRSILPALRLGSGAWPFSHELKLEACFYNKSPWKEVPIVYRSRTGKTKLLNAWKVGITDLLHIAKKRFVR